MIGAHVYGRDSWMCLVPSCVTMVFVCDWYPRVWLWQLGVFGAPLYVGGSWNSWVARCDWQLNVVGAHVCGHGHLM